MTPEFLQDQGFGIYTIDTDFQRAGLVASHLIVERGHAAFLDVGTSHAVPRLLDALARLQIPLTQVDAVLVTHVHLDHAGGAGSLMQHLPNARLIVHPRGVRHMQDPVKLTAGATEVYGKTHMQALFGELIPVPIERIVSAADGFEWALAGRRLLFLDTPGHARHHYCVYDQVSQGFFTGDTFGLSYREFDTAQGAFIVPTTTPIQFDPPVFHESIERLMSFKPQRMFLTHFGCVKSPQTLAPELHRKIDHFAALTHAVAGREDRKEELKRRMQSMVLADLRAHGCTLSTEKCLDLMEIDIELNAQGLLYWLDH